MHTGCGFTVEVNFCFVIIQQRLEMNRIVSGNLTFHPRLDGCAGSSRSSSSSRRCGSGDM